MSGRKKILTLLFATLFASYYTCVTFFAHIHQYSWGDVIHSHPSSSESHSHTTEALRLIDYLSHLTLTFNGIVFYLTILNAAKTAFTAFHINNTVYSLICGSLLRGPPLKAQHINHISAAPAQRH